MLAFLFKGKLLLLGRERHVCSLVRAADCKSGEEVGVVGVVINQMPSSSQRQNL